MDDFKLIESTNGAYAMNSAGQLKNVKTGRILKTDGYGHLTLWYDGAKHMRRIADLLEETHGIPATPVHHKYKHVHVAIRKGKELHYFRTLGLCVRFFESKDYPTGTCRYRLEHRKKFIYGWKITYYENL